MSYVIGSFNIEKLNVKKGDDPKKSFQKIAEIILSEEFDIVALQEIMSDKVFQYEKTLMQYLGTNWDYRWAKSEGISPGSAEGYAYVWNKKKFRLVAEPEIYSRNAAKRRLVRPPYIARFTARDVIGGSSFELRLINTHIASRIPTIVDTEISRTKFRQEELQFLATEIFYWFSTKRYGDMMPHYTIMLGDYNLCLDGAPYLEQIIPLDCHRAFKTVQNEKTSLKRIKNFNDDLSSTEEDIFESPTVDLSRTRFINNSIDYSQFYANNYDHFSYDSFLPSRVSSIMVKRVDALKDYYPDHPEQYLGEISNHVPIKLILDLRGDEE